MERSHLFTFTRQLEWSDAGVVICVEQAANYLCVVQLIPLPPHHLLLH